MPRERHDRTGEMVSIDQGNSIHSHSEPSCAACIDPDPNVRTVHHLSLVRQGGLDRLRIHLREHYAQEGGYQERREAVESLCHWIGNLMQRWAGMADEYTGASLPWWEARQQALQSSNQIAEKAYAHAPETYRLRHPWISRSPDTRSHETFPDSPGFMRVRISSKIVT